VTTQSLNAPVINNVPSNVCECALSNLGSALGDVLGVLVSSNVKNCLAGNGSIVVCSVAVSLRGVAAALSVRICGYIRRRFHKREPIEVDAAYINSVAAGSSGPLSITIAAEAASSQKQIILESDPIQYSVMWPALKVSLCAFFAEAEQRLVYKT